MLIDVPLAENVQAIAAHIRTLGFRVEDVKLMLNTHPHFDQAGALPPSKG